MMQMYKQLPEKQKILVPGKSFNVTDQYLAPKHNLAYSTRDGKPQSQPEYKN